jgi:hypothetical protein
VTKSAKYADSYNQPSKGRKRGGHNGIARHSVRQLPKQAQFNAVIY